MKLRRRTITAERAGIAKTLASLDVAAFAIWTSELVRMAHCSRK